MSKPSYAATESGQEQVRQAIARTGLTQSEIASKVGLRSRMQVSKLMHGRRVESKAFQALCNYLQLDWRKIAGL